MEYQGVRTVHIPVIPPIVMGLCDVCGKGNSGDEMHFHGPDVFGVRIEVTVDFPPYFQDEAKERFVKAAREALERA